METSNLKPFQGLLSIIICKLLNLIAMMYLLLLFLVFSFIAVIEISVEDEFWYEEVRCDDDKRD